MMDSTVNTGMCRCCASEGAFKDIKSSYHWMGEEEIYSDMLRECFDIILNVSEHGDDGGICEVCITQLRNAINFKKQVLHTEEQFQKHLQNKTLFRPNIVKVEVQGEEDSDDNMGSGDEGFSGAEFEVPIKTEVDDPKPKKRAAKASATTTRASAKKAKADAAAGETSTKRTGTITIEVPKANTEEKPKRKRIKGVLTEIGKARREMCEELKKHRSNLQEILTYSNATPFLGINYRGYMCCYCDTQYPDPADLKKHIRDNHRRLYSAVTPIEKISRKDEFCVKLDLTDLRCTLCDAEIDTLENLLEHLKIEHKREIRMDIKNQFLPFKFSSDVLKCCLCPSVFEKFKILQLHMHTHYRNFICEVCDMGYITGGCLKRHAQAHITGEFKCSYCSNTYDTARKVKSHEATVHIHKYLRNKCWYCNKKFNNHQKRDDHVAEVHGVQSNLIKCSACDKTFTSKKSLTRHTRRDHLIERKHKCELCEKKFFTASMLRHHEIVHTGTKDFQCNLCLKAYARKKSLTEHMKKHADDIQI